MLKEGWLDLKGVEGGVIELKVGGKFTRIILLKRFRCLDVCGGAQHTKCGLLR
jgi:hypothetical protein